METTMYDTLLQLPLFQGLCKDDFTTIIERVKFHFCTFSAGEVLFKQDESCNRLSFLLNGQLIAQTKDKQNIYQFSEVIGPPFIIEPYSAFGMNPHYTATYRAHTDVKILNIDKSYILNELIHYEIFRINYLNMLSNRCQAGRLKLWETPGDNLKEKFVHFLSVRSQKPNGEKWLQITMEDLGTLIHETRINVSRALNEWQQQQLLTLKRKEIFIPAMEKLSETLILK